MQLEIEGTLDTSNLEYIIGEAMSVWLDKIKKDSPEVAESLKNAEDGRISKVTVDIQFKLADNPEWQVLSTDNHEGIPELLKVTAETDEEGNLLFDTVKDNDEDSNFSEIEALIAKGISTEDTVIESKYAATVAVKQETIKVSDGIEIRLFTTEGEAVVNVFKDIDGTGFLKLVAEVSFPVEQHESLLEHYKELADLDK